MRRTVLVIVTAAMLLLAGSAAWAATINICDLGEGAPVVTTTGFTSLPLIDNPIIVTANEFANITGTLFGNFINAGAYGIKMLEPAWEGGGVSDIATLIVSPVIPFINTQPFNLTFMSDGACGFDLALAAFNLAFPSAPCLVETGTLQTLFTCGGLVVNAQSDVAVVPLPGSLLLLGTALLGLGFYNRKKS
jgi:hypothetical protein